MRTVSFALSFAARFAARFALSFVALISGLTLLAGGASAAAAPGPDLESTSLIVKFERLAASPILPEDAV
ncbi:MAG: hypothetical protein IT520_17910, partial [Burkholderiales bacterium]|nr:hypothetical protein [Burkholderiales bacterium]